MAPQDEQPEPAIGLPDSIGAHYRVESRIGSGGMGVVYKAIDSRLNRAVAIKAIHHGARAGAGAPSSDRLRTEARTAASLDHPYICKVYELIETAGDSFLVMEFVEGETLAAILHRGPLPLSRTIQLACEIAEGLAAAHARGLVHRDVKPANVMVTAHGHVKLLDFGLAREDVASAPAALTRTSPSDQSAYAGTPQYMAPEQARGEPITARADLFSFGVILFECLSGKLPFAGNTGYDYVRHLLTDDVRSLEKLAPHAPADLVRVIERCLEKVPANRPDSADAILTELRRLAESLSSPIAPLRTIRAERASRRWRIGLAAALLVLVGVAGWRWYVASRTDDTIRQARPFITWPGEERDSRISPDAAWVSFLSTRTGEAQLYVQPIDGTDAKAVALSSGRPTSHVWSPDGRELACALMQQNAVVVQIVPAFFGGQVRQSVALDPAPARIRLLRWIGRAIYLEFEDNRGRSLRRLDLADGRLTDLSTSWKLTGRLRYVDVTPDGRRVAYTMSTDRQEDLFSANLDGSSVTQLTNDAFFERWLLWSGAGTIIYQSNRGGQTDLWEMDPDSQRSWPLRSSQTEDVPESTSGDGKLISFGHASEDARLWLWDGTGRGRPMLTDALSDLSPTVSADGRTLVFQRSQPSPAQGFLILDSKLMVSRLNEAGVASDPKPVADGFAASVSPDGRWLAYFQRGADLTRTTLFVKSLDTDNTITVSTTCPLPVLSIFPVDWAERLLAWSPSSRELYFVDHPTPDASAIRIFRPGALHADPPLAGFESAPLLRDPFLSPDGRSLAYLTVAPNAYSLRVRDLATGVDRVIARFEGGPTDIYLRGWLDRGRFVVVRTLSRGSDRTNEMEVVVIESNGLIRRAALVSHAFTTTSRLDGPRSILYVTRAEQGIHNLFAIALTTGAMKAVTTNPLPGVTYSGFAVLGQDRLIGVEDERRRDIWLIESTRPSSPR